MSGAWRRGVFAVLGVALFGATGCGDFFTGTTSGSGSGSGTGSGTTNPTSGVDRAYVMTAGAKSISGYTIGTGTLTAVPGNPVAASFAPQAAVVTPNGKYLYTAGPGNVNVYTIGSDGSLSLGTAIYIATVVALAISPDGQWMLGLDTLNQVLDEWQINADGTLNTLTPVSYGIAGGVFSPRSLTIAPSGGLIYAALGTAGDAIFSFNTTTGAALQTLTLPALDTQTSDTAIAINAASTTLYLARSGNRGGLSVYTIGSNGSLTSITGSPFAVGQGASSIALEGTGKYVYVANRSDSTISGFVIGTSGGLTPVTGSPFAAGSLVSSIGVDITGSYLVAASFGGSPDVALYSFDTTVPGKLNQAATASIATSAGASLVALTR